MNFNAEDLVNSKAYTFFDWFYKLLVLNLLWIGFTLGGLIIFSIVPATVTVYLILKDLIKGKNVSLFKSFVKIFFSKYYIKVQKLAIILSIFFGIIIIDFQVLSTNDTLENYRTIGFIALNIVTYVGIMTTLHIFPILIYFPYLSLRKTIKYGFLFSFSLPLQSMLMLFVGIGSLVLGYFIPLYLFLIGLSATIGIHLLLIRKKYQNFKGEHPPLTVHDFIK